MTDLFGKKLLIIGGAFQHCKIVEAAKKLGVTTYVTDFLPLEKAPAKQMADHYWMYNITDYDEIVAECKKQGIDGVLATSLDACAIPYQVICERLNLPCYGTRQQFETMRDKRSFKEACACYGVDTIPEYTEAQIMQDDPSVEYPIIVKPVDNGGSKGQDVCYNSDDAKKALIYAKENSPSGKTVIEKFLGNNDDFSCSGFMINGKLCLVRTTDRYTGTKENKMHRSAIACTCPSRYHAMFCRDILSKLEDMFNGLGIKNAPFFIQGMVDGHKIRFYDPAFRFGGWEFARIYEQIYGINLITPLVRFALTGEFPEEYACVHEHADEAGRNTIIIFVPIRPGKITAIKGWEEVLAHPHVVSGFSKYVVGDTIGEHWDVKQRFCEIDVACDSKDELVKTIHWIYDTLCIENENGENMVFAHFDTNKLS